MKVLEAKCIKGFMQMCEDGFTLGFHERNGGNLSYRMKEEEVREISENFTFDRPWQPIGTLVPALSGAHFIVTGSGKFFQNVMRDPEDSFCIAEIDDKGENYRIVWGLVNGGRPTSEFPTHLMNHEVCMKKTDGAHRVIYHGHPENVIALTFILPLSDEVFTRELWEIMTECPVIFPEGLGVIPWMVCGGREIAVKTSELMEKYNAVIWAHHGMFVSNDTFDNTFGLFHAIEKAASIYIKMLSTGRPMLQSITPKNFRDLAEAFDLDLPERFLYEKK